MKLKPWKAGRVRKLPAAATGAHAIGTAALGSFAIGVVAVGALAIGALSIGRLFVGRVRIRRLEIDELVVRRVRVLEQWTLPAVPDPASVAGEGEPSGATTFFEETVASKK